jgi:hypothetical protein
MPMGFAEDCLLVEGSTLMGAKIEVDEQLLYTNSQNRLMREKIRRVFDLMLMN